MSSACSNRYDIIGGTIGVPNHCRSSEVDDDNDTVPPPTVLLRELSEVTWDDNGQPRPSQEHVDHFQLQSQSRASQGALRRRHSFRSAPEKRVRADGVPGNLRRSSLVANESVIPASWFASHGCMSTQSLEEYKEELKQGVVQEADDASSQKPVDDQELDSRSDPHQVFDSSGSLSQTRCTSPNSTQGDFFSSKIEFSARNWSATLSSTALAKLDGPSMKQDCGDLLAEGIEHLSMAMLVNIYGKLREMSLLGHVSVKLRDIDVTSHQYNSRKKELKRIGCWTAADEAKGYLDRTRKAGFIVRSVMDEHDLFEAEYARGGENEVKRAHLAYDASLLRVFKTWVEESRKKQLDTSTETIIARIREECSQRQKARGVMMSSNPSLSRVEKADMSFCVARRRRSLLSASESFQNSSWLEQERKLIEDHFGVKNGLPPSRRQSKGRERSPSQLSGSQISRAIEESSDIFFEKGSVMRNLLESGLEVVWFSDRHPSDIIYGICVNRQTMTITVVFRGQEGTFDLFRKRSMSTFHNPISHEDYDGNSEFINLRSVVADEMLRIRRDTKMSLISEIREKISIIGQELTDDGYHLSVVGHNRGGGYATILGYYLASDMYLKLASAIRVFTFASSPVGCKHFHEGFKHLEEENRLVHARFANSNDLLTSLPLRGYCKETNSSMRYQHVGMQIRLHQASEAGRRRIKRSLDVSYDVKEPVLIGFARAAKNVLSWLWALICLQYAKNYCISEYHHRMHFAREYRLALGNAGALRFDRKRRCLKTLNEYYFMKCRRICDYADFSLDKQSNQVPTWVVMALVACLMIDVSFKLALFCRQIE